MVSSSNTHLNISETVMKVDYFPAYPTKKASSEEIVTFSSQSTNFTSKWCFCWVLIKYEQLLYKEK